jgi:hypothetical protein
MENNSCFLPIAKINTPTVDTNSAAHYINRRPQTLRSWACQDSGPIKPIRIHGRLAWRVSDLKTLLGVA